MKRFFLSFALAAIVASLSLAQSHYHRVSIDVDRNDLPALLELGIPADDGTLVKGKYIVEISEESMKKVSDAGFNYEVLISDMSSFYRDRNQQQEENLAELLKRIVSAGREWTVPDGFELGSVGGYSSIDEMLGHLDEMVAQYPDLVSQVQVLDQLTHEGREIRWVKISDNPNINETGEPEVLYTGMHHAREPIGMQHLLFFMYYLLENYNSDAEVQYLVDNFELYFVPVINMDGYAYNIQTNPYGGGMWRKNRRNNGDGTYGVDLNRNYSYMWGLDNYGSSPYTSDPTYRGPSAFSEPETQAIRDFCESHEFCATLNYHSYGNLLLYPWGYTEDPTPDVDLFETHSDIMVVENGYANKPGVDLYPTNGGSDDWMYGEQSTKDKILAYTPEVGSTIDGFWPSSSRIIPLCQENMWQSIMAAKLCGAYATASDINPVIIPDIEGTWAFEVERIGMLDGAQYTVSVEPLNNAITGVGEAVVFNDLALLEKDTAHFSYTLSGDLQPGDEILFLLSVNNGYITHSDTVSKVFGTPVVVFEDDAETFAKWYSTGWDISDDYAHTGQYSITDSPYGNYGNYENNNMFMLSTIDLTEAAFAVLNFWARWEIESGYDFVQVFASTDEGQTWTALEGALTHPGNANQLLGQPLYDGFQLDWIREEIILSDFLGEEIMLRFVLDSDEWTTEDGFYWDDMTVTIVDLAIGLDEPSAQGSQVWHYPNPVIDEVTLTFERKRPDQVTFYDVTGRLMMNRETGLSEDKIVVDVSDWQPGIYFFRAGFDGERPYVGKIIKK